VKYMILLYGSQQAYDAMAGKATDTASLSPEDFAPMYAFMESWNNDLIESGELVDAQSLAAPVHARRIQLQEGVPVVTDGPYAETEEVLAGYTLVECGSFDRATEIAAMVADCPYPAEAPGEFLVDVRPIAESAGIAAIFCPAPRRGDFSRGAGRLAGLRPGRSDRRVLGLSGEPRVCRASEDIPNRPEPRTGRSIYLKLASVIEPASLMKLAFPAAVTVPSRWPVVPSKMPVPSMTVSLSVALMGWPRPGGSHGLRQLKSGTVSSNVRVPSGSEMVRRSQAPPHPASNCIVSLALP
jgi:hypothetical protein